MAPIDATFGAAWDKRGAFYDGEGRRVGLNLTQGETQDSRTLSLFARLGYELSSSARLDLIASRYELKGDGDYVAVAGNRALGIPTSAVRGTPPGKSAQNRTESVALSLTDSDLGGGNFVSQRGLMALLCGIFLAVNKRCSVAIFLRCFQPGGRAVCGNKTDFKALSVLCQRGHVAAAAGNKDGNLHHFIL